VSRHGVAVSLLLALVDGAGFATAVRRNGKPGRIRLPDDAESRAALVDTHLRGSPATLEFHAEGHSPWRERVDAVVLAAFCPGTDGLCRWLGIDLDAADHGQGGLADPSHAVRTIAERADHAGLLDGLLVARSRRGQGRHAFLLLPGPVPLDDAVLGVAALTAAAFRVASRDAEEGEVSHAFRCASGAIASPGAAGSVELFPHSTSRPPHGWAMLLPLAGALKVHGGGIVVDPFEDQPLEPTAIPCCCPKAWDTLITETRSALAEQEVSVMVRRAERRSSSTRRPLDRIDPRTRSFLDGEAVEGTRNVSAFAAAANLIGCGVSERDAEHLILAGATACGLPEREARAALRSAARAIARKRGPA
jgi:hypothetical protein